MKKLFKEYFVSYISIMLIPVIIMTLYLNTFERMLVKKIALDTYEEKLANASQRIESIILNKNVLATQWFYNNAFSYTNIQNDFSVLQSVFSFLRQSEIEDDSVAQILYLFREERFVIASNHTTAYENVDLYSFRDIDGIWSEYSDVISEAEETMFLPCFNAEINGRIKRVLPYIKPGRDDGGAGETIIFLFDADRLFESIGSIFGESFDNILLFYGDELVAAENGFENGKIPTREELGIKSGTATFERRIALFGLDMIITVPSRIVYGDINRMGLMCAAVFLLCIMLGALLAGITVKKRLKPFETFWSKVSSAYPAENFVPAGWNDAMTHLHGVAEHFTEMDVSYKKMRDCIRGLVYKSMLIKDYKFFEGMESEVTGLTVGEDDVYAAMIAENGDEKICDYMEEKFRDTDVSSFFFKEKGSIIGILNCKLRNDGDKISEVIKEIENGNPKVRIGKFYRGIENLSKSYFEIKGVSDEKSDLIYPYDKISEFSARVKQSDFAGANAVVREIVEEYEKELPFFLLKCLIVNLLLSYLKVMEEKRFFKTFSMERYLKDISVIQNAQTIEEFKELLYMSCEEWNICLSGKEDEDRDVIDGIKRYIDDNYTDCEFSLKGHDEIFGDKSKSYISGLFKAVTGLTMTEYLWHKRLEKAIELIETTDLPINEISVRVGYSIPNSFIRKFKASVGITPNEYRRQKEK